VKVRWEPSFPWLLLGRGVKLLRQEDEFAHCGGCAIAGAKPALSPRGELAVVGEVRLSDRGCLLARLGLDGAGWQGSDTEIVARAWERWGVASLGEMEGAFNFAVWEVDGEPQAWRSSSAISWQKGR
jgi:hypothetical protein